MMRAALIRWLQGPPVTGWLALVVGMAAIWVPTVIRASVNGVITGCEFTPYLPFVFACAILLRWWQAGAVALASVAIMGGLFGGSELIDFDCFVGSAGMFAGASAAMIGFAMIVRRAFQGEHDLPQDGIVFSTEKDDVWASWHGNGPPVRLGSRRKVSENMLRFLANEPSDEPPGGKG